MLESGALPFPNLVADTCGRSWWGQVLPTLCGPCTAAGLLVRLFPDYSCIDSLVMRDFYHHYTVDAHSLMAIENIHRLRQPAAAWERPFSEIFSDLEQPELLFLSLLFHDVRQGHALRRSRDRRQHA